MAIFICQKCMHIKEVANQALIGKTAKCPACQHPGQLIHDTQELLKALLEQSSQLQTEIAKLKQQVSLTAKNQSPSKNNSSDSIVSSGYAFANISASPELSDHQGVIQWFERQQIKVSYDEKTMDIAGFFDEIAVKLGDQYETFSFLLEKIKYHQRKGHKTLSLDLSSRSQQETGVIKNFCQELYESAFITRYYVDKQDKKRISLSLQFDPRIVNFFNGEWLEWFVFMKVATLLVNQKRSFSCLKNFLIHFANGDKHEIDLFFLIDNTLPLWLECKSGEFRNDIEKYTKLRNVLKVEKNYFWLIVLGLADEKTVGLTGMFGITIVNEKSVLTTLTNLLSQIPSPPALTKNEEKKSASLWSSVSSSFTGNKKANKK